MDVKTLVLGTSLGLLLSGVAWWSSRGTSSQTPPAQPTVTSVESRETVRQAAAPEALQAETVQLRHAVHALDQQVRQLTASQAASAAPAAPHNAWSADTTIAKRLQQLEGQVATLADRQDSSDRTATEHAATPPADHTPATPAQALALAYNTTLAKEAYDTTWEGERQSHFEHFFHTLEVTGARLQAAECRTTLCRLQVTLDNQQAQAQLMHAMSALLEADAEGALVMDDDNALHVTVYLSRSGYALPAQSQ
jgi:hypothetical protein